MAKRAKNFLLLYLYSQTKNFRNMKKRIPSKTSNFADLIQENGYYVDKTAFIKQLEAISDKYLFYLRPRRFGKSLLVSMLEHYYGIQYKESFSTLFGNYYIGKEENTTSLRNRYYILSLNFSGIMTEVEDSIYSNFSKEVSTQVQKFLEIYKLFPNEKNKEILKETGAIDLLRSFFTAVSTLPREVKIFILIDEYDHFTNELFAFKPGHFKEIVSQNGWVRKFYEVIKRFTGEGIIDRFFATGVTPVTLDSMTSGFNIARDITTDPFFHNMTGFTENEVVEVINGTLNDNLRFDLDILIEDIRSWYNGSKFSVKADQKLYNPQLVLNFLGFFDAHSEYPVSMYDPSVSSDYTKIRKQLELLDTSESDEILREIVENEKIQGGLTAQFNFEKTFTRTELISFLFYNGMLTIHSGEGKIIDYVVPNYVIKTMYWDLIRERFLINEIGIFKETDILEIFKEMRFEGKVNKLMAYLNELLKKIVSNRDLIRFTEANLKMLMLPVLSFSDIYKINSEIEINRKYLDLLLTLQPEYKGRFSFLFELKYVKKSEEVRYEEIKKTGQSQLKNYLKSNGLHKNSELKAFLIIFLNDEGEAIEVE